MEGSVVLRQPDLHQRRHRELTVTLPAGTWFSLPLALNRCLAIAIPFGRRTVSSYVVTIDNIPTQGARNTTSSSTTSGGGTSDDQQPRQLPDTGQ